MFQPHILIAGNDLATRQLLTLEFKTTGFEVTAVGNGKLALDQFLLHGTNYFGAILTGFNMPVMSGLSLLQIIHHHPLRGKTILAMYTSENECTRRLVTRTTSAFVYCKRTVGQPGELRLLVNQLSEALKAG